MNNSQKIFTIIGSVAVVAAAGIGGYKLFATPDSSVSPTPAPTAAVQSSQVASVQPSASTPAAITTSAYKDGTYNAQASYRVPHGGNNTVSAQVTVAGGKISDVTVNDSFTDGESESYVSGFESEIKSTIKGQSLSDISVSRVGGASLTSEAFNAVLDTIRNDAKA